MRKHTKSENTAIGTLYKSQKTFEQIVADCALLKKQRVKDDEAFMFMGMLFGYHIVSPRQLSVLREEWLRPSHEEFRERNMWSLLNATTESLKSCPPVTTMEKHGQAYNLLTHGKLPALTA